MAALLAREMWAASIPCWVKYAGNWQPAGREAFSYTLQRWWLRSHLKNGMVTVNGRWPGQPPIFILSTIPACPRKNILQANQIAQGKEIRTPLELLFVGRLERAKGVHRILEIARILRAEEINFHLTLVGDGPERPVFEETIQRLDLNPYINLVGWQPRNSLPAFYRDAHILLLPSSSEGWPKVLSEAMAYGAVPIVSALSSIPQTLAESRAGITLPADDIKGFAAAVRFLVITHGSGSKPAWPGHSWQLVPPMRITWIR